MWEEKKNTTLPVGTKVRLETGEAGIIVSNSRLNDYQVELETEVRENVRTFVNYRFLTPVS